MTALARRACRAARSCSPTNTDDNRDITVTAAWAARHDLSHAYAMTLHKAQGLTIDHALLYCSTALTREAGYVGLSRGRRENHIYAITAEPSARTGECDFAKPNPPMGLVRGLPSYELGSNLKHDDGEKSDP